MGRTVVVMLAAATAALGACQAGSLVPDAGGGAGGTGGYGRYGLASPVPGREAERLRGPRGRHDRAARVAAAERHLVHVQRRERDVPAGARADDGQRATPGVRPRGAADLGAVGPEAARTRCTRGGRTAHLGRRHRRRHQHAADARRRLSTRDPRCLTTSRRSPASRSGRWRRRARTSSLRLKLPMTRRDADRGRRRVRRVRHLQVQRRLGRGVHAAEQRKLEAGDGPVRGPGIPAGRLGRRLPVEPADVTCDPDPVESTQRDLRFLDRRRVSHTLGRDEAASLAVGSPCWR